ncbi:NADPH-dependent FMN reductase [Reyranella sp. CPCC 100927]|uniref:NADPH-dependent FMN reductase n=1 Tax=Reyranella sp. CPCC 100927 TaxID=2599616 RepID=UPI0011B479C7|nr:NAD(P)H-dependent oxidoreductase [Reyranella sp. CPCC 100927]TWT11451.1 NAD(P)H-dependent oxidoreductase [Reyranella sp. CPCC 100927]
MSSKINVALIYGSTRESRFCDTVARWAGNAIVDHGNFALDVIDPASLSLPARHQRADNPGLAALRERITHADAFVLVTPEYNHGYPAALKFLIDSVSEPWHAKPAGFVSYGGISGGLRAVEQLRLVLAELHVVTLRDSVSFANVYDQFDAAGDLVRPEPARRAMAILLARLDWWARALRSARYAAPYGKVAA